MRIAFVFDRMIWGGIERVGLSYINMLVNSGNEVDVYILDDKNESIVERIDKKCNLRIINLNKRILPENMWFYATDYNLKGIEILAFFIRFFVSKLLLPFSRIKYGNRVKYDVGIAFSGHIADLSFVAEGFLKAKKKIAWLHGSEYQYMSYSPAFFRLYKKIKNLVCLSNCYDDVCKEFNLKNKINKVKIYNPFDVSEYVINKNKVEQLKNKYGDFCLMVGRLAKDKDQATVVKAIAYLKTKYNFTGNMLFVGEGPEREKIQHLINKLGLNNCVFLLGNKTDVQNYYKAAKVFVHSSPFEGLPTVLLEAMSFDIPIVTTNSMPGVEEIICKNDCGLISPVYDEKKLAENIYKVFYDNELRRELIEAGHKRLCDFSTDKIKKELFDYIRKI